MPWVYLDDHFDENVKVLHARELHRDAPWLYVAGLTYCRRSNTEGLIVGPQIPRLITDYSPKAKDALVKAGLWLDAGHGSIQVHDWSQWNRSNDAKSASARNAARVRWSRDKEAKNHA